MLFNISEDPHEQHDLAGSAPKLTSEGSSILEDWTDEQLSRSYSPEDPMEIVLDEGDLFMFGDIFRHTSNG